MESNTIKEYWDALDKRAFSEITTPQTRDLLRNVFYAGAGVVFNLILKRINEGEPIFDILIEVTAFLGGLDVKRESNAKPEQSDEARVN